MNNRTTPRLAVNPAGNYEIRWTENRVTKRVSCNTKDKAEAEHALARHLLKVTAQKAENTTVAAILADYDREHVNEKVVAKDRQRDCMKVLSQGIGNYDVRELAPDVMRKYRDDRKAGRVNGHKVQDSTLRRELNCLVAAINHAVAHKRLDAKDAPTIMLPEAPPPKDLWLTGEELDAFIIASADCYGVQSRIHRFVAIAADTAARKNSIVTLRWSQVDLKAGLIHFQNDGNKRTKKRRVPVPMSAELHRILSKSWEVRTQDEWVLDTPYSIQHHFDAVKEFAFKRTAISKFKEVTPHTLRHTWATLAAQAGVPLFEVSGVIGDTLSTVVRVYAHHCPDHLRDAVNWRDRAGRLSVL